MSGGYVATLGATLGKVYVKHSHGAMEAGAWGTPLYTGDTVYTLADSYADIKFVIGSSVGLNENTIIKVTGARQVEDLTQYTLFQEAVFTVGEVWAKITKQQEEVQFETKGGVIAIKG